MNFDRLDNDDIAHLLLMFEPEGGDCTCGCCAFLANVCDSLRVERARRKIQQAFDTDPIGYTWGLHRLADDGGTPE